MTVKSMADYYFEWCEVNPEKERADKAMEKIIDRMMWFEAGDTITKDAQGFYEHIWDLRFQTIINYLKQQGL